MICGQVKEIGLMCRSSSSAALHFHTSMNVQMPLLLRTEIYKNSLLNRVHPQKQLACNNIHLMLNHMIKSLNITIMPALTNNSAGDQQDRWEKHKCKISIMMEGQRRHWPRLPEPRQESQGWGTTCWRNLVQKQEIWIRTTKRYHPSPHSGEE